MYCLSSVFWGVITPHHSVLTYTFPNDHRTLVYFACICHKDVFLFAYISCIYVEIYYDDIFRSVSSQGE